MSRERRPGPASRRSGIAGTDRRRRRPRARGSDGPWDRWAFLYDLQKGLERPALRTLAEMLGAAGGGDSLLDVGTGTGAMLEALAASGDPPRQAVGIDSSSRMLARIGEPPPGWEVREGDARRLPFADGEFAAATAAYLLHILSEADRAAVLAELHRVLAPGGRLGVVTIASPVHRLDRILRSPISRLAARSGGSLGGMRPLDPRPDLAAAGFAPLAARRINRGYPSLCVVAERHWDRRLGVVVRPR